MDEEAAADPYEAACPWAELEAAGALTDEWLVECVPLLAGSDEADELAAAAAAVAVECDEAEAAAVLVCGLAVHDAVPGMELAVTGVLPAVDELSSACECGTHTESGCTVRPSIRDRWGNSVYCGRCGMGAVLSACAGARMSGLGGVDAGADSDGDSGRLMAI